MNVTVIAILVSTLGTNCEDLAKGLRDLEIRGRIETFILYSITNISQNTEKNFGDLRRLAVTQTSMRIHQPLLA